VIDDETEKAVYFAHIAPDPRFEGGNETLGVRVRLRGAFPHAGRYTVQVWFYQELGNDVLKGELPFLVEGD
jgi:hypothetical protein